MSWIAYPGPLKSIALLFWSNSISESSNISSKCLLFWSTSIYSFTLGALHFFIYYLSRLYGHTKSFRILCYFLCNFDKLCILKIFPTRSHYGRLLQGIFPPQDISVAYLSYTYSHSRHCIASYDKVHKNEYFPSKTIAQLSSKICI